MRGSLLALLLCAQSQTPLAGQPPSAQTRPGASHFVLLRVVTAWLPFETTGSWEVAMRLKQLSDFRLYEATIYPDKNLVELYAFDSSFDPLGPLSERESYAIKAYGIPVGVASPCMSFPTDPPGACAPASAALRDAFTDIFETIN